MATHSFVFHDDPEVTLAFSCLGGSHTKFTIALEKVMQTIPWPDRKMLLAYWCPTAEAPRIAIENTHAIDATLHGTLKKVVGMNDDKGNTLRFAGLAITGMPDPLLEMLIAHEFAHAVVTVELFTKTLPSEEREAWGEIGADFDGVELSQEVLDQITDWNETFANKRMNEWNNDYDGEKLLKWWSKYVTQLP